VTDPVIIVGAGPTGLCAAALLAARGIRCVVIERRSYIYPLPRAVHVDDEGMRILQAAGVAETFAAMTRPALGLRLLDSRHRTIAEFARSAELGVHGYPQANMFDQPDLEQVLRDQLRTTPLVELWIGHEVVAIDQLTRGGGVDVTVRDGETDGRRVVRGAFALGCDGANSTIRELVGADVDDLGFAERWLVIDARTDRALEAWNGVHQVCDPARAATYMRIGPDRYRWEFRLRDSEDVMAMCEPGVLGPLIAPWTGRRDLAGVEIVRAAAYTFRARLTDPWRNGRVFLLGDAAHETPPFIGQGLGAGLRDAINLAWKLAAVIGDGADAALLETYESERVPVARALIGKAVTAGWAMTGGRGAAAGVRRVALSVLCRIPAVRHAVLDRPAPALRGGALISSARWPGGLGGTLIPQPLISVGGQARRLDDLMGQGFAVVSDRPLTAQVAAVARRLDAAVVVDHGAGLGDWLRRGRAAAVIVRPDRVVMAATDRTGQLDRGALATVERLLRLLSSRSAPAGVEHGADQKQPARDHEDVADHLDDR
jgi:3-(3-hydroxy-phenyl)propionate hydroxylase